MMRLILTMLVPTFGYVLGEHLEVSAPLAMVVSGILIGNITRKYITEQSAGQMAQ